MFAESQPFQGGTSCESPDCGRPHSSLPMGRMQVCPLGPKVIAWRSSWSRMEQRQRSGSKAPNIPWPLLDVSCVAKFLQMTRRSGKNSVLFVLGGFLPRGDSASGRRCEHESETNSIMGLDQPKGGCERNSPVRGWADRFPGRSMPPVLCGGSTVLCSSS